MVSDDGSRIFLMIFFNAAVKYFAVVVIMLVAVAVVIMSLWGNQEIVLQYKLNQWKVSKFDGNENVQDWCQGTIQRGHVETTTRNIWGVHE